MAPAAPTRAAHFYGYNLGGGGIDANTASGNGKTNTVYLRLYSDELLRDIDPQIVPGRQAAGRRTAANCGTAAHALNSTHTLDVGCRSSIRC